MISNKNDRIYQLPFDQFSRQEWARLIIEQFRAKSQSFKILDVGGYKGETSAFQANDNVWVCDLFDVGGDNYVKGDGRSLPFDTKSFDFVLSFDTYEHIPENDRKRFINELVRVSKLGVILAAPFDENENGPASKAELKLNDYHKQLYGSDHKWLKEHIDFKIPEAKKTEELLRRENLSFSVLLNNDIDIWAITQFIYFSIELDDELRGRVDDLNRMYSKHFAFLDKVDSYSYRRIYFISTDKNKAQKINSFIDAQPNLDRSHKLDYIIFVLNLFGRKYADVVGYKNYLEDEVDKVKKS